MKLDEFNKTLRSSNTEKSLLKLQDYCINSALKPQLFLVNQKLYKLTDKEKYFEIAALLSVQIDNSYQSQWFKRKLLSSKNQNPLILSIAGCIYFLSGNKPFIPYIKKAYKNLTKYKPKKYYSSITKMLIGFCFLTSDDNEEKKIGRLLLKNCKKILYLN